MDEQSLLTCLKGIGEKKAAVFGKAGITTIGDLIGYYPRDYETFEAPLDYPELTDGRIAAVCGFIEGSVSVRYVKSFKITSTKIRLPGGLLSVVWYNMPFLRSQIRPGAQYVLRGRVRAKGKGFILEQPGIYDPARYDELMQSLLPVYPLVKGLTENALRGALTQAFAALGPAREYLPDSIRKRANLASLSFATEKIHFPADKEEMGIARRRLIFDEFFLFILQLRLLRESRQMVLRDHSFAAGTHADAAIASLPYALTGAQQRVWEQIRQDLCGRQVMARLVQGDVGSGKTILAFLALILTAENGAQGALMVPTEVLARQHYEAFTSLMKDQPFACEAVLLTGSMKEKEKREARRKIAEGEAQVIIGTHALIQEKVEYKNLALVVTDEQHRFGVRQRETLGVKGEDPHVLVMSATPIPRTLAVILYGDLDVSVLDEMPARRLPIKSAVVDRSWRPNAARFILGQIREGHQAYIICPMVEESEAVDAENVTDYAEKLRGQFPADVTIGVLHGRMKPQEKNEVMERFLSGEIKVLVSTTVVEVGVDVPNATVMMIENAERFGLAQLHQLRGRVGRGSAQSYCIFMRGDRDGAGEQRGGDGGKEGKDMTGDRLQILRDTTDGFEIARRDLALRGPGDLFGVRQSGIMQFKLADPFEDHEIMQYAGECAGALLQQDSTLEREENAPLKQKLLLYMANCSKNINI